MLRFTFRSFSFRASSTILGASPEIKKAEMIDFLTLASYVLRYTSASVSFALLP